LELLHPLNLNTSGCGLRKRADLALHFGGLFVQQGFPLFGPGPQHRHTCRMFAPACLDFFEFQQLRACTHQFLEFPTLGFPGAQSSRSVLLSVIARRGGTTLIGTPAACAAKTKIDSHTGYAPDGKLFSACSMASSVFRIWRAGADKSTSSRDLATSTPMYLIVVVLIGSYSDW
jgi:hypothetical protein